MICFRNPGLIELRGIRAFGVNAKIHENPHGFWGTGAKHAIAGFLRLGCSITLCRGLDRYTFGTKQSSMRGKDFAFVTLNHPDGTEEELAYTLELGKSWEGWQLYRELASNAFDEKGEVVRLSKNVLGGKYKPRDNETAIVVEGDEVEKAYSQHNQIFLNSEPLFVHEDVKVHPGQSEWAYYRGVRAYKLPRASMFTYDLARLPSGLTEERTFKSPAEMDLRVGALVCRTSEKQYLEAVCVAPQDTYEYHLSSFWAEDPSEEMLETYTRMRQNGRLKELTSLATAAYLRRHKHLPLPDPAPLNRVQEKQLERAIAFCQARGWNVKEYLIVVVPHARDGVLAWAQDNTIVLTLGVFARGTKEVATALYEEWLHLKTGLRDESRDMQNHLMSELFSMAELVAGEPV